MTAPGAMPAPARRSTRWLLLGSLAVNLFFIGIAIALAVRPGPREGDRDIFTRIERIGESLPKNDAAILMAQMKASRGAIETTEEQYRAGQEAIRASFRNEPFDLNTVRAAMSETRAARLAFDTAVQDAFVTAASQMSQAGRVALADWRARRGPDDNKKR